MRSRYLQGLARLNGFAAVVLFAGLTMVVTLQVLTRFVLHTPFIWSEEVARFLFFWVVMLGAAMSVRTRRHFVIDIPVIRRAIRGRLNRFLFDIIPDLCILGFTILLLVQGISYTRAGLFRTATNSQINMALVYVAIPLFAALTIMYSADNLLRDWAAFREGRDAEARRPLGAE